MDKGVCRCLKSRAWCAICIRSTGPAIDLGAALNELGVLNSTEERENMANRDRRLLRESRTCFEQSPPLWINNPTSFNHAGSPPLKVDIGYVKDPPLQPPNSPVSPQQPFEPFRLRDGLGDTVPQRSEWDGRLLAGRRITMKGRQRMLSGPNGNSSSMVGSSDRYAERMRSDRAAGWRPYRIPRPKLLNMGHCSRMRTISATLHEEPDGRLPPIADASPIASASDALRYMAIEDNTNKLSRTLETNCESSVNFPRSRSAENLERRAMDVAANTLDSVSDKIEKLHVT